ncbi:acyl carrier protein [Streptomyces sp. 110]|uniref:Acyl carrier protein n=1 Tax=Streptomyces endocoffeicus TaxID=2898945 RepID=A0ABS1PSC9_9ACTN|nr:phosphopantetheine-binding protein [Streptomyces endocoffeicus]MBL1115337.1 acyl carrier protein [Streptomyces endocoffeicus]
MSTAYDRLASLLNTKLGVAKEEITPDATFEDLDMDSLALVELTDVLDAAFGIKLDENQVTKETKLTEVASLLKAQEVDRP